MATAVPSVRAARQVHDLDTSMGSSVGSSCTLAADA